MHAKLIEAASFFDASDAHILRGLLEAEDIKVEIFNEQFSSLTPVDSAISGGVRLFISSADINKAEPIIQAYYDNLKIKEGNVCPACGSLDVSRDYGTQFKAFCYAALGAFFGTGFNRKTPQFKRCNRCGEQW